MTRSATSLRVVFVAVLAASTSFAEESVFPSKAELAMAKQLNPGEISGDVRKFLKSKMKSHGKDVRDLLMSVATLRYAEAKRAAQGLANAPRLDAAAGPSVNVSPGFFALQDQLKRAAGEVVTAAEAQNAEQLEKSFDLVIKTCMGCHNAFTQAVKDGADKPKTP